ncbi:unnamed protein product [Sphagnum compactum]
MRSIKQRTKKNPLSILRQAIRKALAIRWLLRASRKRPSQNMAFKLSYELMDVARDNGNAIRRKEETHRMVEANRGFAHFR